MSWVLGRENPVVPGAALKASIKAVYYLLPLSASLCQLVGYALFTYHNTHCLHIMNIYVIITHVSLHIT